MLSRKITRMLPGNSHSQLGRRPTYCAGVEEEAAVLYTHKSRCDAAAVVAAAAAHLTNLAAGGKSTFFSG